MYEVIVVGLGISGLCQIHSLSKRGISSIGLEQFSEEGCEGSSKGPSRITRQAYFLDPDSYFPLIQNSYKLWEELEQESGEKLFLKTGMIYWDSMINGETNHQVISTAKKNGYPVQVLFQKEALIEEPFFKVEEEDYYAVIEKDAGILLADKIDRALKYVIKKKFSNLAKLKYNTKIIQVKKEYDEDNKAIYVVLSGNKEEFRGRNLILSTGSWVVEFFDIFPSLKPYRPYFKIETALVVHFKFKNPVLNRSLTKPFYISRKQHHLYGFPDINDGNFFKIGIFHYYTHDDEQDFQRKIKHNEFDKENYAVLERIAKDYINHFDKNNIDVVYYTRCSFTMTEDENYIIDRIPNEESAFIVSACSGHGFKYQNTIGEHVADLVQNKAKPFKSFELNRFYKQPQPKF